jgi:hypothetical protein
MTSLADRASSLLVRSGVERLELSRRGEVLAQLSGPGEPHWIQLSEQGERELVPDQDDELPLARDLERLRVMQRAKVLAWRPGRRMVVLVERAEAPGGKAVLKGLRAGRFRTALERQLEGSRVGRAVGLAVPDVLAMEPERSAFALTWKGETTVPVAAKSAQHFVRLGAAIARFQRAEGSAELATHGVDDELTVLDELAAKSVRLRGALPPDWEHARQRVELALRSTPPRPSVQTHRDLHDGQLLDVAGDVALLDFDLLCRADEALDPANLLAHLELRHLQGLADSAGALACAQAFRVGYGREGEAELAQRMRAWQAVSLLRLALVYHLRPPYAHLSRVLVERALTHLLEA